MTDIKNQPCPFCGSEDISDGEVLTDRPNGGAATQSMCRGCGALGPEAMLPEGEVDYGDVRAIEAWNRRPAERTTSPVRVEEFSTHEVIGKIIDQMSQLQMLWGLNEPGALVRFREVSDVLFAASRACRAHVAAAAPHAPHAAPEQGNETADPQPTYAEWRKVVSLLQKIISTVRTGPAIELALQCLDSLDAWSDKVAASHQPKDERAAFESWAASRLASIHRHKAAGHDLNGSYISVSTQAALEAWQARAAMAKGGAANCQDNEGEK